MKKLAMVLLLAWGCRSTTEAVPLTGELYVLQSVAGFGLPTSYAPTAGFNIVVYADTLALRNDGTGERHTILDGNSAGTRATEVTDFTWAKSGSQLTINFCPPKASCLVASYMTGTLAPGGQLTITQSTISPLPLVYQYLFPPD